MVVTEKIVCLANSRKGGGRCLAGIVVEGPRKGSWIRPVGRRKEALDKEEVRLDSGAAIHVLDVIEVQLDEHVPVENQPENWRIADSWRPRKIRELGMGELDELTQVPDVLWGVGYETQLGINDKCALAQAMEYESSLAFIRVGWMKLSFERKGQSDPKLLGYFRWKGREYKLKVTDPEYETPFWGEKTEHALPYGCCLTLSLTRPYVDGDGYCHKLIATILEVDPTIGRMLPYRPCS